MLLSAAEVTMKDLMEQHVEQYHVVDVTNADMQTSGYFKRDPFNVNDVTT